LIHSRSVRDAQGIVRLPIHPMSADSTLVFDVSQRSIGARGMRGLDAAILRVRFLWYNRPADSEGHFLLPILKTYTGGYHHV
jgi:hypothetical protein